MSKKLREAVSKEKRRYHINGFDLDLSYVLPRVIAMGFPSESVEAAYRNPYKEAYRFLEAFHHDHYRVYNLCSERGYDPAKFHNRVAVFPFDDHNAPPFEMVERFCHDVDEWLRADPQNVAVVHCKAGKGRTGLMICAYLVWTREWETADEALGFYAAIRTYNKKGVTIPSQVRYVHYTEDWLRRSITYMHPPPLFLTRVVLRPRPKLPDGAELSFCLYVAQTLVFKSKPEEHGKAAARALEAKRSEAAAAASAAASAPAGESDRQLEILKIEAIDRLKQAMVEGGETEDGLAGFEFLTAFANHSREQGGVFGEWGDEPVSFDMPQVPLCGDCLLEAYARTFGGPEHLFSAWFNTAFIRNRRVVLAKFELDKALKDKKFFAPHFTVEMLFSDQQSMSAQTTSPAAAAATPASPAATSPAAAAATPASPTDTPTSPAESPAPPTTPTHGSQALHERLFQPIETVGGAADIPHTCSTPVPLNITLGTTSVGPSGRTPVEVATDLLERILRIYLRCGYMGIVLDDAVADVSHHLDFEAFHRATAELDGVDLTLLKTSEDKLAFWLNVRNLMALHATAIVHWRRDPTGPICISAKEWSGMTVEARYSIGHLQFTLHEVENMVLRPGMAAPDNGVSGVPVVPFKEGDARKRFVVEERDHRIPLAFTHCATSSPRVLVFHPCTVNEELDQAAELFMRNNSYIPPHARGAQAFVPKYVQWYARDFPKKRDFIEFVSKLVHVPQLADYDVKYNEFDWEIRVYLDHLAPAFAITHKLPVVVPQPVAAVSTAQQETQQPEAAAAAVESPAVTPRKHRKHHHHHSKKPKEDESTTTTTTTTQQ